MTWVDSHCHLTDLRLMDSQGEVIARARESGVSCFMLGGVDPDEWTRQVQLSEERPLNIGLCLGLHPYFIAGNEEEICEGSLDQLAKKIGELRRKSSPSLKGLGETGLDFRPHIMKDSQERQIRFFEAQIELASIVDLPLVLHIVQAHEKALMVYDFFGNQKQRGGMVHAFSGSLEIAEQWIRRGFLISVGGAVTYEKNQKLQHAVKHLPLEWLILESDSPDQKPQGWVKNLNEPSSLIEVALKIAHLRGITAKDVLDLSKNNFERVFGPFPT